MRIIFSFLLAIACTQLKAQEIKITNVQLKGDNVEISYSISDERIDRSYSINLYSSADNYIQPLEKVSGDIGVDIPVGANKKVVWHAKEELGADFNSSLSLELKGNYYVPFVNLEGFYEGRELKRGKSYDIVWSGGRGDNVLSFELYKGETLVKSFEEKPNTGNTTLNIPLKVKPGTGYRFRISDANNRDEVVYTESFTIERKIPLYGQIGGVTVIGVAAYLLIDALIPEPRIRISDPPSPSR